MVLASKVILVSDNYHTDLKLARQSGLVKGKNPTKEDLYTAIAAYNKTRYEAQGVDEMIDLIKTENGISDIENDVNSRVSLLPRPILKADRVPAAKPILKKDRNLAIDIDPLKRPAHRPVLKADRKIAPRPKLNKANRNYI